MYALAAPPRGGDRWPRCGLVAHPNYTNDGSFADAAHTARQGSSPADRLIADVSERPVALAAWPARPPSRPAPPQQPSSRPTPGAASRTADRCPRPCRRSAPTLHRSRSRTALSPDHHRTITGQSVRYPPLCSRGRGLWFGLCLIVCGLRLPVIHSWLRYVRARSPTRRLISGWCRTSCSSLTCWCSSHGCWRGHRGQLRRCSPAAVSCALPHPVAFGCAVWCG